MGMTIDEIIQDIEVIKAQAEWDYPIDWQIVLDEAIETMRKYQKITEIIEAWKADVDIDSYDCIADIYEVLGDGTDK